MKNKKYLFIALKGLAMGAADVIPGVSGGTIAFITGIYEELLGSIKNIDGVALKLLFTGKFREFWKKVNGNFLLAVFCGIGVSIFSLARAMTWLLEHHPIPLWSFFFGLISASVFLVGRDVSKWNVVNVLGVVAGAVAAYFITVMSPSETPDAWWFIILSGAVAICAMVLPGISGSFILLLMGKYAFVMAAVAGLDVKILALFAVGAVLGIVGFSHFLTWLLKNYRNIAIAVLTGFMAGSLNKIWPWKHTPEPLREVNVWPADFAGNAQVGWAVAFFVVGVGVIVAVELADRWLKAKKVATA